jgi:hypothetical protein
MIAESYKYETIHTSSIRSSCYELIYISKLKEFKVEELLQDTLPIYFNERNIEQVLKIDCQSIITDEKFIQCIDKLDLERAYKP